MVDTTMTDAVESTGPRVIRRLAWLHFANDFTLDFLTPLLPAGVGVAWLGIMEGLADGIGQVLKLFTGRASDRSGRRTTWVRGGYRINALARPLAAVGMLAALPWWIVCCRVADRVGKGVRGSATDALVADWTTGEARITAFNRMRTFDHLGATLGSLSAALAAWWLAPQDLWLAVAALAVVTVWVVWLTRGLCDNSPTLAASPTKAAGWWPQAPSLRRPLSALGIAALATRISPLLVLVQVAGLTADGTSQRWPLWQICLGWAALSLVQAGAAAFAGAVSVRLGPVWMLRAGWVATAVVFIALALASGPWLIAAGIAFGVLIGLTEGAEKALLADCAPQAERGVTFGAMALVTAVTGLIGNALGGVLLGWWGSEIFLVLAVTPMVAIVVLGRQRESYSIP